MQNVPLSELTYLVRNILATLRMEPQKGEATILALRGDLGAGKTTFVQHLARELGAEAVVQSPTYVLMKTYELPQTRTSFGGKRVFRTLVHIDAYRLERPEEFMALRPEEFLRDPGVLLVVEWPERLRGVLPAPDMTIAFSAEGAGEGERYIEVT